MEKDATRLENMQGLSEEVKRNLYVLPVKVKVMLDKQEKFEETILSYVQKNSKNSTLTKEKNRKLNEQKEIRNSRKNIMKSGNVEGKVQQDFFGRIETPFRLVNNKVILPSEQEQEENPRSRSAKLRIAEKK